VLLVLGCTCAPVNARNEATQKCIERPLVAISPADRQYGLAQFYICAIIKYMPGGNSLATHVLNKNTFSVFN